VCDEQNFLNDVAGRPPMGGTAADRLRPILLAGKRAGLSESA